MGAHTRAMTGVGLEGVHAQARDISFLIGFAQTLKQVDLSHIAVAGWSWGGLSNFFAAADDDRITALIASRWVRSLLSKDDRRLQRS
jgi:dienelactone hydrolase